MSDLKRAVAAAAQGPGEPGSGGLVRRFRFEASFLGFQGHFPGRPILPAVAQFLAAVVVAEGQAGCPLRLAAVERAKFHRVIEPGDEVRVECRPRPGVPAVDATVSVGTVLASAFVLRFADEEGTP